MAKHLGKDEFKRIMRSRYWLRGHFLVMLLCTALITLAASHVLLAMGLQNIMVRYLVCLIFSYVSFLILLRIWLGLYIFPKAETETADLVIEGLDAATAFPDWGCPIPHVKGQGGASSGGGASSDWDGLTLPKIEMPPLDGLDDDSAPVVLPLIAIIAILALAFFLIAALGFAIYAAPAILCEIALEMAVTIGIVRLTLKEKHLSKGDWLWAALRKTVLPFIGLIIATMGALGIALHYNPQITKMSELWSLIF